MYKDHVLLQPVPRKTGSSQHREIPANPEDLLDIEKKRLPAGIRNYRNAI